MEGTCPASLFTPQVSAAAGDDSSLGRRASNPFSPFSPMDSSFGAEPTSTTTPRRRLSLNVDENAQSPFEQNIDQGYAGSQGSGCSSLEASLSSYQAHELVGLPEEHASTRSPLAELGNGGNGGDVRQGSRKTLQARRLKKAVSMCEGGKENSSLRSSLSIKFASPFPRPSSLPSLSLSPFARASPSSLINSPLERMSLISPATATSHPHRSVSSESDGYFSEVFEAGEGDEMMEEGGGASPAPLSGPLSSLLSAPIAVTAAEKPAVRSAGSHSATPTRPAPSFQRSDSWCPSRLLTSQRSTSLKRSSPASEVVPVQQPKRPPVPIFSSSSNSSPPRRTLKGTPLHRSQSCSVVTRADGRAAPPSPSSDEELVGDFSRAYALPLVKGAVADLKNITPDTLASLISGEWSETVQHFSIIDCRYPYEFEGGHVRGAVNIWDREELKETYFLAPRHPEEGQRSVIVFHCEFSSKRGPDMSRFMRKLDREQNGMDFPSLYYSELYLLDGGYKAFHEMYPSLCDPIGYLRMLDERHKDALKHFKQRSKSWTGEGCGTRRRPSCRPRRATAYDHASLFGVGGVTSSAVNSSQPQ